MIELIIHISSVALCIKIKAAACLNDNTEFAPNCIFSIVLYLIVC